MKKAIVNKDAIIASFRHDYSLDRGFAFQWRVLHSAVLKYS
jgi:hypothetical protein